MKVAGSGFESGSISQRQRSADPDPDPHQNVMDPEHCFIHYLLFRGRIRRFSYNIKIIPEHQHCLDSWKSPAHVPAGLPGAGIPGAAPPGAVLPGAVLPWRAHNGNVHAQQGGEGVGYLVPDIVVRVVPVRPDRPRRQLFILLFFFNKWLI
jgi:hypothetical protein